MLKMMKTRNVGNLDRIIRIMPTVLTAWLWSNGTLIGPPLYAAAFVSLGFLMTSILGSCSIYYALGWSTCPISGQPRR